LNSELSLCDISYQACDSLYLDNGFSSEQASELMRGAVGIAQQAISKVGGDKQREIGLSLGPFGGTLSPGQE
jgi:S-methylmethionine-dependent homocysteine/selenocysteine methylase